MYKSFFIVVRFDCLYFVVYKEENSICHIKVQTPYIQKANISFKTAWKLVSLCPNVLYWADWHLFMDVIFLDADFNLHFLKVYLEVDFSIQPKVSCFHTLFYCLAKNVGFQGVAYKIIYINLDENQYKLSQEVRSKCYQRGPSGL